VSADHGCCSGIVVDVHMDTEKALGQQSGKHEGDGAELTTLCSVVPSKNFVPGHCWVARVGLPGG
jgi:hypothetical protein